MNIHTRIAFPLLALLLAASVALSPSSIFADAPIVNVPSSCSVTDSEGIAHEYSSQFLAICALVAAEAQGAVSSYTLAYDAAFGFYLLTINGTTPSSTEYWALYLNGAYANDGLSSLILANGDVLSFQLTDWSTNTDVGSPVTFKVSLQSTQKLASSGGGQIVITFNVPAALRFLSEKQNSNGSFGADMITDWTAIALVSAGESEATNLVRTYMRTHTASISSITDYERHAMALMALGIDPYIGTPTDYITPIVNSFDGTQIGVPSLVNDDIFALFPLPKVGYNAESEIIQDTIAFILSKQNKNGSWEESVDLTAAAIQALSPFASINGVGSAIESAKVYLSNSRQPNGEWKNSFEASWVVQALHAAKVSISSWVKDGKSPISTLASAQQTDGGVESKTNSDAHRIWATAYAIPAALGKTWNDVLHSFSKPSAPIIALAVSTTTAVTIAEESVATSTQEIVIEIPTSANAMTLPEPELLVSPTPEPVQPKETDLITETMLSDEQVPVIEETSASSQAAAVGTLALPDTVYLLILPLLLILSAFFGALLFGPVLRALRRLF